MHENFEQDTRVLRDDELDAVAGGTEGFPGIPLGTNINMSPWGRTSWWMWDLVGAIGTVPR